MKKFLAILLALTLTLSLGITAFAAKVTDSSKTADISVSGIEDGTRVVVTSYPIATTEFNSTTGTMHTTVNANVQQWLTDNDLSLPGQGATESEKATFYSKLASAIRNNNNPLSITGTAMTKGNAAGDGSYTYTENVGMGLHLILVTGASAKIYQAVAIPVQATVKTNEDGNYWDLEAPETVAVKSTTITIDKAESKTTMGIGDEVTFTLTADVPVNPTDTTTALAINDTMSDTLNYSDNLTVKGYYVAADVTDSTKGVDITDYTNTDWFSATKLHGDATLTFSDYSKISSYAKIVVTYTAKLNETAVITNGTTASATNLATVSWGNEYTSGSSSKDIKTYGAKIIKVDGENNTTQLNDASFKIYKVGTDGTTLTAMTFTKNVDGYYYPDAASTATVVTTANFGRGDAAETGVLYIKGLDVGTYKYEETAAPDGYTLMTEKGTITVAAEATTYVDNKVSNYKGVTLPATGGMGTTIFTVLGALIVLTSGLFLALNRKRIFGK